MSTPASSTGAISTSGVSASPLNPSDLAAEIARIEQEALDRVAAIKRETEARAADLRRQQEEAAEAERTRKRGEIDQLRSRLGFESDAALILFIRDTTKDPALEQKGPARRIPPETIALVRKLLEKGGKVTEMSKHFGISEAYLNKLKKQWKLVKRKNVALRPLKEIMGEVSAAKK